MSLPEFEDLPFFERPDLTPYLVHLTKNTKSKDGCSGLDNLENILREGEIWGSSKRKGFIKGPHPATCFMDVPFGALKYVLNPRDSDPNDPRYEPYGIVVTKRYAHEIGCRPVLYLGNRELERLKIPEREWWRIVRFDVSEAGWISWLHEREWRCKGDFELPSRLICALVRTPTEAEKLQQRIAKNPKDFRTRPRAIIPLSVVCQGLPKR